MYREKLIKSLGTPEAKQYITEILSPAILLAHVHEDSCWRIIDARDVDIKEFEFEDLDKLINAFDGEVLAKDENFCLLTKSDDEDKKSMLKKYWQQTTTLEELNSDKHTLTKFTYQLLNLEKLIPSLLEPFPIEILLNILIDSLGEIFTSSAAAYTSLESGKIKKVGSVGHYEFPEELDRFNRCYAGSVIEEDSFLVSSISEEENQYFIIFKRDTLFQEEEVSILKMLTSLLQKSRHLLNEQSKQLEVETLVSQFEFALQILKNFSVTILSSFDEKELQKNICDAIKEMFQAEYISIYERIANTERFKLLQFVDLKKRKFDETVELSVCIETGKIETEAPFYYQKCYGIKTDSDREILIFMGESVLENYYKKEIIQTLDKIIPTEINRAFSNVDAINTVKEQSEYIENIARNMLYISENLQEIEKVGNKKKLLEKINDLSEYSMNTRFEDLKLYEKDTSEDKKIMTVGSDDSILGSVVFEKETSSDMKEDYMLSFLSQIALQTNEKINVFKPDESITDFEDVAVDFLKVKYRLAGFTGKPSVFQLDADLINSESLDGYGVGIKVGSTVFFASYLSGADLNRLFE
jgi:23S rRNA maturation mini-RNase III